MADKFVQWETPLLHKTAKQPTPESRCLFRTLWPELLPITCQTRQADQYGGLLVLHMSGTGFRDDPNLENELRPVRTNFRLS